VEHSEILKKHKPPLSDLFLEMMSVERSASGHTIRNYEKALNDFTNFATSRKENLVTIGAQDISAWLENLRKTGLAASTVSLKVSALKQFFSFLYAEGFREDNPAASIARPARRRPLPKDLSEEEMLALLSAIGEDTTPRGLRLRAMTEIAYAAGLRVSELVSLPKSVANVSDTLIVRGKGRKERLVPLGKSARTAIAAYLNVREQFLPKGIARKEANQYLFPSRSKQGFVTRVCFSSALKDAATRAGIDPDRVSPHVMRHAFATHLLSGGADLRSLQQMLGHADITTTEIYAHVSNDRLSRLVQDFHPLNEQNDV